MAIPSAPKTCITIYLFICTCYRYCRNRFLDANACNIDLLNGILFLLQISINLACIVIFIYFDHNCLF